MNSTTAPSFVFTKDPFLTLCEAIEIAKNDSTCWLDVHAMIEFHDPKTGESGYKLAGREEATHYDFQVRSENEEVDIIYEVENVPPEKSSFVESYIKELFKI